MNLTDSQIAQLWDYTQQAMGQIALLLNSANIWTLFFMIFGFTVAVSIIVMVISWPLRKLGFTSRV